MFFMAHLFACFMFASAGGCVGSEGVCWVDRYCPGPAALFDDDVRQTTPRLFETNNKHERNKRI